MVRQFFGPPLLAAVVLASLLTLRPSPYMILTPGGSYEIGPRLRIPEDRRKEMGTIAFTAVYTQDANWAEVIGAYASRSAEVVPAEDIRPPGVSQEQVNQTNRRLIDESKPVAALVALRAAGFDVKITGQGAEVGGIVAGMPAEGVLQKDDVIVAVDGLPIQTSAELIEAVRRHAVGDQVGLEILRGGERQRVSIGTRGSPTEPDRPMVGIYISTKGFEVDFPFPVEVDSDGVGGPSAGLMFSLAIFDAVTDGDLTRGYRVAGTGTIAMDGSVGPVGGAAEKILAAERDGAQVFIVPRQNLEDAARRAKRSTRVIPVERFEDALRALCAAEPRPGSPKEPPAVCASRS